MAFGPGKYDDLCTYAREQAGITHGGGVVLIVIGGKRGDGFSCQADAGLTLALPDLLENLARQIREHGIAG